MRFSKNISLPFSGPKNKYIYICKIPLMANIAHEPTPHRNLKRWD